MALRSRGAARSMPTVMSSQSMLTPWAAAVRGPKKKKGASKSEAPDSSDIVNIFKDRPDPEIHATDRYPPFLMGLIEDNYTPDDVMMQMYRGERIPTANEQWTLVGSFRRTYLNDQNRYMKNSWEYESDDDIGEDTGALGEEDASQVVVASESTPAAGEAKKEGGDDKKEAEKK